MAALSVPSIRNLNSTAQIQAGGKSESRFRLMLVHDGYEHLDRVIDDLHGRNFPADSDVLLLSVSDLFRTPLHMVGKNVSHPAPRCASRVPSLPSYRKTKAFFDKLESVKRQAHAKLQAAFPHWEISFERPLGWQPDLIYLGAQNQSSVANPGFGEIIRKISNESTVPVIVLGQQPDDRSVSRPEVFAFGGPASRGGNDSSAGMASSA